jgi:hypothetical protein
MLKVMNSVSRYHWTDIIVSQRDIPGLPYNDMFIIRCYISDEMASFVCLEKQPQSALKMLNMQTMCSSIIGGKGRQSSETAT